MRVFYYKSKRSDDTLAEAFIPSEWGMENGVKPYVRVYPFNIMLEAMFNPRIEDVITISYVHELCHVFEPNMTERQVRRMEKTVLKAIDLQRNQVLNFS